MDDWVILAPTRWKLRKAIALMNQTLHLQEQGSSAAAYCSSVAAPATTPAPAGNTPRPTPARRPRFRSCRLQVATKTIRNFLDKCSQLYEQNASEERVGAYVRRWVQWCFGGMGECLENIFVVY